MTEIAEKSPPWEALRAYLSEDPDLGGMATADNPGALEALVLIKHGDPGPDGVHTLMTAQRLLLTAAAALMRDYPYIEERYVTVTELLYEHIRSHGWEPDCEGGWKKER